MHVAEGAERIRCPYCGTEYILKSHNKQEISVHVINLSLIHISLRLAICRYSAALEIISVSAMS